MARLAATAVGGYVPTPTHLIGAIASRIKIDSDRLYVLDPCAGEGKAIFDLLSIIRERNWASKSQMVVPTDLMVVEMESNRARALKALCDRVEYPHRATVLAGDAFKVQWGDPFWGAGVGLLFLNPPYDHSLSERKLEVKFLKRFTQALAVGGVLVFVIPVSALGPCAELLGSNYENIHCCRFPGSDYDVYKQVVVFARRTTELLTPSESILERVRGWAADPRSLPELVIGPVLVEAETGGGGLSAFSLGELDVVRACQEFQQWTQTTKKGKIEAVPGVLPAASLFDTQYPLAVPPRSAHIAAGIAAGIFNGREIRSSEPGMPPLLIKGVFEKSWVTTEEADDIVSQQQRPRLVTTALDLGSYEYTTFIASAEITHAKDIKSMTMGDLLHYYGKSLMDVMLRQCPVLHDPSKPDHRIPLVGVNRTLFPAQEQATMAAVKLLGGLNCKRRRFKSAFLLGEVGTGKTTVALSTLATIGAKTTLVVCPSHLVQEWEDQVREILPKAVVVVIETLEDLQGLLKVRAETVVALLSKEKAKLGHAHESVRGRCPTCGEPVDPAIDAAKRRARCGRYELEPKNKAAELLLRYGQQMFLEHPDSDLAFQTYRTHTQKRWAAAYRRKVAEDSSLRVSGSDSGIYKDLYSFLVEEVRGGDFKFAWPLCTLLAMRQELLPAWSSELAAIRDGFDRFAPGWWQMCQGFGRLATTIEDPEVRGAYVAAHRSEQSSISGWVTDSDGDCIFTGLWDGLSKTELAKKLLTELNSLAQFGKSEPCGEFLYQAVPKPRRVSLAKYIVKYLPDYFQLLILDEGHEYATDGSAQEKAAHRLTALGIPTLLLTGTIMNGYASSLFANLWSLSSEFRREFRRDEMQRFVDVYGLRKRVLSYENKEIDFGTFTDRAEKETITGMAPGVLPLLLIKYLLPTAVTLHKADLSVEIPPSQEEVVVISPTPEQLRVHELGLQRLLGQIEEDRKDKERAGKLFGALAEYPAQLDLASEDVGNQEDHSYEIRYPQSLDRELLLKLESTPKEEISPKEAWMLDTLKREILAGRHTLIYVWHTESPLGPRLSRLIKDRLGARVAILDAARVPPKKRKRWIDDQVVAKGVQVLICNPTTIQTGLNNLVYFSTSIYMENPGCKPIVKRQTDGRIDRIGQLLATKIYSPVYENTTQTHLHSLLMHKVAVSMGVDGLDAEEALRAAGVADDKDFTAFSVGRQLYDMLKDNRPLGDKYRAADVLKKLEPPRPLISDESINEIMASWAD